jgi:hypothetical protein
MFQAERSDLPNGSCTQRDGAITKVVVNMDEWRLGVSSTWLKIRRLDILCGIPLRMLRSSRIGSMAWISEAERARLRDMGLRLGLSGVTPYGPSGVG